MKHLKRILSFLLVLSLLFCGVRAAGAEEAQEAADYLAGLGVFRGSDKGYELDREPTRIEALIKLLRLLGEEETAQGFAGSCIFTDVPRWASCYVAYAYDRGYTKGAIHDPIRQRYVFDTYGAANANMYLTFVLRALGYGEEDFRYTEAVEAAQRLGPPARRHGHPGFPPGRPGPGEPGSTLRPGQGTGLHPGGEAGAG